jgi:hypothetical protein
VGQALSALQDPSEIRAERVALVREAIAAGVYETEDKIQATVSRLLDALRSPDDAAV